MSLLWKMGNFELFFNFFVDDKVERLDSNLKQDLTLHLPIFKDSGNLWPKCDAYRPQANQSRCFRFESDVSSREVEIQITRYTE